jgi:hypothetical protein
MFAGDARTHSDHELREAVIEPVIETRKKESPPAPIRANLENDVSVTEIVQMFDPLLCIGVDVDHRPAFLLFQRHRLVGVARVRELSLGVGVAYERGHPARQRSVLQMCWSPLEFPAAKSGGLPIICWISRSFLPPRMDPIPGYPEPGVIGPGQFSACSSYPQTHYLLLSAWLSLECSISTKVFSRSS